MPICTHCTQYLPFLYTVYESAYNLRLEQCPSCNEFADPYVEHDALTLLIDLILLKRDVYRHLLFNRGLGRRKAVVSKRAGDEAEVQKLMHAERMRWDNHRWFLILRLGVALVAVDGFIRWTHLHSPPPEASGDAAYAEQWNKEASSGFLRTFIGCLIETIAFHLGITFASFTVLAAIDRWRALWPTTSPAAKSASSGVRREFRYAQIPLTLLYSSLPKLFLLFLLSIWRPSLASSSQVTANTSGAGSMSTAAAVFSSFDHPLIADVRRLLDDEQFDREWVVRNVLGGMAAGFGLRVVLDCHPIFTMMIILAGWAMKTGTASLLSEWVGGDQKLSEAWLAYSIP